MLNSKLLWTVSVVALISFAAVAGEKGDEGDEGRNRKPPELGPDGIPKFYHPYTDGLYSTVTAMNMFWVPEVETQKRVKLKVDGFKKEYPVYVTMKDHKAPLAVVLMGVDGKADGPWGGLFPYWYAEAGYHVLTFDGTFTPEYPALCGQGVVGNFDEETNQVAAIIDAFLKQPGVKDKVTKVGVLGMSFGGTQALLLAAKAKEGKLPFELCGVLALSPLVKMRTSARIVDKFFAQDRWDTTMVELAQRFMPHVPVAEGQKHPFSDTEMRAAIGFAFRDGLRKVVDRNDSAYKLKILPDKDGDENRDTHAEATGLTRFVEQFTFAYWQKKGKVKTVDELWGQSELVNVLPRLPDYAEAVVAANDPFNEPQDLQDAQAADANKRLTVLPRGGHLGFIAADWTLVKALRLFKDKRGAGTDVQDKRTPDQARKDAVDSVKDALRQEVPPKK